MGNKKVRKYRKVETAFEKNVRLLNDSNLLDHINFFKDENSDFKDVSLGLYNLSMGLRLNKCHSLVRELLSKAHQQEVTFGKVIDVQLKEPEVLKDIDALVKLFAKIIDVNKEYDSKEYMKRKDIFERRYRDFEFHLRRFFDTTEVLLNALCLNYDGIKSYNDILYIAKTYNIITDLEYKVFKVFGQIRNLFLHNDPNEVIYSSMCLDNFLMYKAAIVSVHDILNRLNMAYITRLSVFVLKVHTERGDSKEEAIKLLHEAYVKMLRVDREMGVTYTNFILDRNTHFDLKKKSEEPLAPNLDKDMLVDELKEIINDRDKLTKILKENNITVNEDEIEKLQELLEKV